MGPVILVLNTLRRKIPYELHQNWCIKNIGSLERHTKSLILDSATTIDIIIIIFIVIKSMATTLIIFSYCCHNQENVVFLYFRVQGQLSEA